MRFEATDELMIKPELEKWIVRLEKHVEKIDPEEDYNETLSSLCKKLEEENYHAVVEQIFNSLSATNNREYFTLYERFCQALGNIGRIESVFMKYTDHPAYQYFFSQRETELKNEILSEITEYVELNGKKYTVSEYQELASKINEINNTFLATIIHTGLRARDARHKTMESKTKEFNEDIGFEIENNH